MQLGQNDMVAVFDQIGYASSKVSNFIIYDLTVIII